MDLKDLKLIFDRKTVELVKSPFWYLFKSRKVGLSAYDSRGLETKILKREGRWGKLGQGVGALKMGGWNPLANYGMYFSFINTSDLI